MPKVSVVLLLNENEKDAEKSLENLLSQSLGGLELVVVCDFSFENVLKRIEKFQKKDDRIRVLNIEQNLNFSKKINEAFKKATGKYLTWATPKTLYKKEALGVLEKFLEKNKDIDLVCASSKRKNTLDLLEENVIGNCFLFTRKIENSIREIYGGLNPNLTHFQDYDFFFKIAIKGKIAFLNENLFEVPLKPLILKEADKKRALKIREKYAQDLLQKMHFPREKQIQTFINLYLKNKSETIWLKKAIDIDPELFLRNILKNWFRLFEFFKIQNEKKNVVFNFLSYRLRFKHFLNRKLYNAFKNKKIEPKTILILEYNDCHFETMTGLMKYCLDLGYKVDILTRRNPEKMFDNVSFLGVRIFKANEKTFDKILKNFDFSSYERIIFNSKAFYEGKKEGIKKGIKKEIYDISEVLNPIPKGKKENIYLQHHLEFLKPENKKAREIILANPSKDKALENLVVNCNYFQKETNKKIQKNDIVNFISIGELSKKRRNSALLIKAIFELYKKGFRNFKVTIIGNGNMETLPSGLLEHFDVLGRIDYQSMFEEIKNADFILPLLDPTLKEHERYLSLGTSGSFQLAYGFLKPCVLHGAFAKVYDFTNENSIIYEKNEDFVLALQKALEMENKDYQTIVQNLKTKKEKLNEKSLKNLSDILKL